MKTAQEIQIITQQQNWKKLEDRIEVVAKDGKNNCWTESPLSQDQQIKLTEMGYRVEWSESNKCHQVYW